MNLLHTYGAKLDYKDRKISLRDEKDHMHVFIGKRPCHLRTATKPSWLSCQVSIEYWCVPTIFIGYISIVTVYEFGDVASKKLPRLSPKETLIFKLT